MNRPLRKLGFALISCFLGLGCTSSKEPPLVKVFEKSIATTEEKIAEIEATIKKIPEQNQGLLLQLNQDKQLALSRLERLKENLFTLAPNKKQEAKSAEGEGHH
jgi:t-SNARE complex subunit (syntaxin)